MSWLRLTAADNKPLHAVRVLKGAAAPVASPVIASKPHVDLGTMSVRAVLTTRSPDRQGDIVDPTGGDFGEHRVNPVVLFHHGKDHRLPIGKAEDPDGNYTVQLVKAADGHLLLGTTYFSQNNKFANDVFGLVAEDILRGVSIGFDPSADADSVEELGVSPVLDRPALHFKSWKLLEYSHTPIGVNRDALTVAVHKSLDGSKKLHPLLEKALIPLAQPRRATVSTAGAGFEERIAGDPYQVSEDAMARAKNRVKGAKKPGGAVAELAGKKLKPGDVSPATSGVAKAMDYDNDYGSDASGGDEGYNPAVDDPNSDPNLPPGMTGREGEETPPTVAALLDGAQGVMDLCTQLEASIKKGEHPEGRKFATAICGKLRALAAKMKSRAEGIHGELNGQDYGDDADQNADEDAGEPTEPPEGGESEEPETDDEGALVTKGGYQPRRFVLAGSDPVPVARSGDGSAGRLKALEAENKELAATLERLLTDLEAGRNRNR